MNISIPGASMASAALAISQAAKPKPCCVRCHRDGVAVITQSGLCQSCSTKLEGIAAGLTPVMRPEPIKFIPNV
ncbi:hypothetical protein phiA034_gene0027 [Aeromonas phage phiA034]|uniref:Uncharacterized protein n=2 Tax=Sharonstreetvirus TaxID=2943019 RepID=A0AAE9YKK0_9CAUD|nr:hypothetical protein phiA034_gene0027 [Aeromonas phage phiA034]